jgi:hypothetical protein
MRDKLPLMATAMQLVYVSLFYKLAFALVHPFRAFVLVRSLEISICLCLRAASVVHHILRQLKSCVFTTCFQIWRVNCYAVSFSSPVFYLVPIQGKTKSTCKEHEKVTVIT